jgi:hypothetical protein
MSFCLEQHLQQSEDYKILIKNTGFKEAKKVIEKHSPTRVYVNAGEKILGARIIGIPPIPIGINDSESKVTLPYTKPCHGTAVVELPLEKDEIEKIRSSAIKD